MEYVITKPGAVRVYLNGCFSLGLWKIMRKGEGNFAQNP